MCLVYHDVFSLIKCFVCVLLRCVLASETFQFFLFSETAQMKTVILGICVTRYVFFS